MSDDRSQQLWAQRVKAIFSGRRRRSAAQGNAEAFGAAACRPGAERSSKVNSSVGGATSAVIKAAGVCDAARVGRRQSL